MDFEFERFQSRHIGPDDTERDAMLEAAGAPSLDALIDQAVPARIRLAKPLDLPPGLPEHQFLGELRRTASRNQIFRSHIGLGYYDCITPSVILRNVLENPGWYTPYTPYQAEIAQGRLEGLLNFQTTVSDLTGMEIANASLLDEATGRRGDDAPAPRPRQAARRRGWPGAVFRGGLLLRADDRRPARPRRAARHRFS
jgi:glycine dehydrogenase